MFATLLGTERWGSAGLCYRFSRVPALQEHHETHSGTPEPSAQLRELPIGSE